MNQQGGGGGLPYDWVSTALQNSYYKNTDLYKTEPIPIIPLTGESINEVSLEEVAKHLKALIGPVRSAKEFQLSIEEKRGIRIGQEQESIFESISIPWIKEVEMALRSSIPQGMNTEGMFTIDKISMSDPRSYPLLIWSLIASAPATNDMMPVLGP